ncbi:hypothetical protein BT69DRAFT_659415 [Atractiella rhizophila]|nr:hypothetical protein BT69DRAFT_659415 [Atractiella rhizophila]
MASNIQRFLLLFFLVTLLFILRRFFFLYPPYSTSSYIPTSSSPHSSLSNYSDLAILTLSSTLLRLHDELPITLDSLLRQSVRPKEIQVYLPEKERTEIQDMELPWQFYDERVRIRFVEDRGPATKFLYALKEVIDEAGRGKEWLLEQEVVVVDDDHSYSPDLLSTLLEARNSYPDAALGMRGWRVRDDLHWGVPFDEVPYHVIQSYAIREPYRVSVLTANEGYMVKPRFFLSSDVLESRGRLPKGTPLSNFSPLSLRADSDAPTLHLVDDIFMAGTLCSLGVKRYVVPLPPRALPNLDITVSHTLEEHMDNDGVSRAEANNQALKYFEGPWRVEGLWYRFMSQQGGRYQPKWVGVKVKLSRWWATKSHKRWLRSVWGSKIKFNG